jgi:thiol-disulfide isomerase/thioredoxin
MLGAALTGAGADPAAAPVAPGDVVLVDFSATWCGPCRSMAPLIGEIAAAGWAVRHVDVDREGDLVRRFGVTGVPCYVLLVKGQEIGRINGATTRRELETLLAKSRPVVGLSPRAEPPAVAAAAIAGIPFPETPLQSPLVTEPPAKPHVPVDAVVAGPAVSRAAPAPVVPPAAAEGSLPLQSAPPLSPESRAALESRLMAATARLRVEDAQGVCWGTGTVIDCRQGEALILTCGHIFRDSKGKGRIEVDLFGADGSRGIAGQIVSWDLKRDLALVSIFTDQKVEPARVGGQDRMTATGEPVVTVGCNGGKDPTIHHSRVTAVDKYLGPANVQVAGQPVQGRSGGGLFAVDGTLIGVCNAADPTDNEGLFAALPAIHEQLDEAGLAFVYRSAYPSGAVAASGAAGAGLAVPSMPERMPAVSFDRRDRADALPTASTGEHPAAAAPGPLSAGEQALIDHVRQHEGRAEVICIVRPHNAAHDASEVFVLQGSTREFVEHLSKAHGGNAVQQGGRPSASARSDLAVLPAAEQLR